MTTRHPVSFSSIARMELTELPTHVKGAWQVTASRWPDRENKVNRHSPRSHCHCLTRSPTHPASIHSFTQHSSTDRGSIYLPRIQSKRRESVTCNLQPTSNQSCTDIINQQLTCGPRALCLPWPVKKSAWCTWYTYSSPITAHWAQYPIHLPLTKRCHSFQRRRIFFNLQIIRVGWISWGNDSPVDQRRLTLIDHNRVPGVPGMVPTSTQTPHIKRVPNISHYRHQAVFVQPRHRQNRTIQVQDNLTFILCTAGSTYLLFFSIQYWRPFVYPSTVLPLKNPLSRCEVRCHGWRGCDGARLPKGRTRHSSNQRPRHRRRM